MGKHVNPRNWASKRPFGIGLQRPNNYAEIARAVKENRGSLRHAWRILNEGVCDGCALGTSGMRDWTLEGTHLCNVRLRLLRLNTMPAFDPSLLADAKALEGKRAADLRELGRLPVPMVRRNGEPGFQTTDWDTALELIADRIRATGPDRVAAFVTSRGIPNESYYGIQKAMRALGSPHIDNAARICHSPSTYGLRDTLGVGATTCSYSDWIGSDLVVFIGANPANNQPVAMKYLHHAKAAGTEVVSINPYREPGMDRYWVPSVPESAVFGTRVTDHWFGIDSGGDLAFLIGTLKHLVAQGWVDREFVADHTTGFDELVIAVSDHDWESLERGSGVPRSEMLAFAELVHRARTAVFVWSMGVSQHTSGEETVRAIVDVALTGGFVGREKCGLMPIRGHSGVQGGAEMGCYATALPGGDPITPEASRSLSRKWGFDVPARPGHTAPEMIDAAAAGNLDALISVGGNWLEVLPDPGWVEQSLRRVPLRVHLDIVVTPQMLIEPAEEVVLLPAATRYEVPGGVTETSTERRVIFSPEIDRPRNPQARAEWQVFGELAARVKPELSKKVVFEGTAQMRAEIAEVIPMYDGIQNLREKGDQFQYGGARLCEGWEFPTDDGRAHFRPVTVDVPEAPAGMLRLTTRRGKQFNSMVQERSDAITGAGRDSIMMSAADAAGLGLSDGDRITASSGSGTFEGRLLVAPLKSGNVQVHWPEGNVLIERGRRSPEAGIPDYGAWVKITTRDP